MAGKIVHLSPRRHKPIKHGESGYVNHGCRCEICRSARMAALNRRKAAHPELNQKWRKDYYLRKRDLYLKKCRDYYDRNRDRILERDRTRYKTSKGKAMSMKHAYNRRMRESKAGGVFTETQIEARWLFYGNRCYLCGCVASHNDHVIPLIKGGSNWPSNIRPACPPCNNRKAKRRISELPLEMRLKMYCPRPQGKLPL
jgi:5-methylcytosine-specific restriction endonuclease McrA